MRTIALAFALLWSVALALPAGADSFEVSEILGCPNGLGVHCNETTVHDEGSGYQDADHVGWLYLTAFNDGSELWGDFHFELLSSPPDYDPVTNTFFKMGGYFGPTSSQTITDVALSGDGHILDVYFYGDPVAPGEHLSINVVINNATAKIPYFGVRYYPTPVPEPGTAALLGFALLGVLAAARRGTR